MDSTDRDRKYLQKLQRQAGSAATSDAPQRNGDDALEELRRWEGQAAFAAESVSRSQAKAAPAPVVPVVPGNPDAWSMDESLLDSVGAKFRQAKYAPGGSRDLTRQTPYYSAPRSAVRGDPSSLMPNNILAVLSLVFSFGGGLLGIVFGHIAVYQINRSGERGGGMAIAGLVIGYLWLLVLVVIMFSGLIAIGSTRSF